MQILVPQLTLNPAELGFTEEVVSERPLLRTAQQRGSGVPRMPGPVRNVKASAWMNVSRRRRSVLSGKSWMYETNTQENLDRTLDNEHR